MTDDHKTVYRCAVAAWTSCIDILIALYMLFDFNSMYISTSRYKQYWFHFDTNHLVFISFVDAWYETLFILASFHPVRSSFIDTFHSSWRNSDRS